MMSTLGQGDFELAVRQQPKYACVAIGKGKERKPIDPPPIVQLMVNPRKDPARTFLQNPYLILTARLIRKGDEDQDEQTGPKESDLTGTLVSSLYSLKDTDNSQGGFFVFGDLSVRRVGTYRLAFILYELRLAEKECWLLSRTVSDPFVVYATKTFPGLAESTFLTRSFSDQGVRLRLRKDSRTVSTKKRTISQADQMRATGGMHHHHHGGAGGYLTHDPSSVGHHDLTSPNGHHSPHHLRRLSSLHDQAQLDRARSSLGSQGSYYSDSPALRGAGEYTSAGAYGYAPAYDDHHHHHHAAHSHHHKPKRIRMDAAAPDSPHGSATGAYDTTAGASPADYGAPHHHHPYAHHAHPPRTVPDPLTGYALTTTTTTSPPTTSYPAAALPYPATAASSSATSTPPTLLHASMPRLDTSHLPPHSPPMGAAAAPGSATSAFSPGSVSRRSPTGGYAVGGVGGVGYPAMYASPPTAGGLVYGHHGGQQGLGIALPGLEMDGGR